MLGQSGGVKTTTAIQLDRATTAERIAAALRDLIADRELAPGARLQEIRFTDMFGVSRHTFREAVALLVGEGLLTRESFKGVTVTALTEDDIRDIYAARRAIELPAVDALATATLEVRRDLNEAIAAMMALAGSTDSRRAHSADSGVHRALVAALGSRRMSAAYAALMREQQILLFSAYRPADIAAAVAAHAAFGRMVRAGEFQAARAQLDDRLRHSEAKMIARCMTRDQLTTPSPA